MKNIIFITNSFPFGEGEKSFIAPEFNILKDRFKFTVVARNTNDVKTTKCPDDINILRYDSSANYNAGKLLLRAAFKKDLYKEIFHCIKCGKAKKNILMNIIRVMMRSIHFSEYLKNVRKQISDESVLFYTYWNDYATYACTKVKEKSDKIISRIHGADLYLERSNGYQPYKAIINDKIDALYFISKAGFEYYKKTYKDYGDKQRLAYMGVKKSDKQITVNTTDTLNLVTVSRCVEVKRLDLLIEGLAKVKDIKVRWVHVGDGEEYEHLKKKAEDLLKDNITFEFKGYMENCDVVPYIVSAKFDFLVNVSYSEGLPVTMMEVMSCGLPVIATNVGGVSEIVKHGENGYLIDKDISREELGEFLSEVSKLSETEKINMSKIAYNTWEKNFYDEKNYINFAEELEKI